MTMTIEYRQTRDFTEEDLRRLFLSVGWESGRYPKRLVTAMRNSTHVISAWDGDRLIGLVRALDDSSVMVPRVAIARDTISVIVVAFIKIPMSFRDTGKVTKICLYFVLSEQIVTVYFLLPKSLRR